jgi:hypothetical protein
MIDNEELFAFLVDVCQQINLTTGRYQMVASNHPTDLETALREIEALKRELAEQGRRFQFELKLLDLALANIFDFLKKMAGKDDMAVACALAREKQHSSRRRPPMRHAEERGWISGASKALPALLTAISVPISTISRAPAMSKSAKPLLGDVHGRTTADLQA